MTRFDEDQLREYGGRLVLEDHLSELGLKVKVRRVGCRLVATAAVEMIPAARRALDQVAPGVEIQLIGQGTDGRMFECPACSNAVPASSGPFAVTAIRVNSAEPGNRVRCPRCETLFELMEGQEGRWLKFVDEVAGDVGEP